jgi:hypothetical protein
MSFLPDDIDDVDIKFLVGEAVDVGSGLADEMVGVFANGFRSIDLASVRFGTTPRTSSEPGRGSDTSDRPHR